MVKKIVAIKTEVLKTITLSIVLLLALSSRCYAQSYSESFNDITTLAGSGWVMTNASIAVGSTSWFQGNNVGAGGPFDAYNGATNAYIGANYNNTGSTGTISNWLMAPNRTLRNGDVLTFYTRKPSPDNYADRLEVRLSTNGASTNVGSGNAVGDYTTLLMSVNPSLVLGVYPTTWTLYTITISGLPAPTSGRMAFRYFVTSAGLSGTNSDYIGIDQVDYTPYVCPAFTMTTGGALTGGAWGVSYSGGLTQTGALGAPSYAVTAGALPPGLTLSAGGTISGTPTALGTFNFTATVNDASGCSGSQSYSITVIDPDDDGDSFGNSVDNCPTVTNADQLDTDSDSAGDACDAFPNDPTETLDTDGDTLGNNADNCPSVANPDQEDADSDNIGDACDTDVDGDGTNNATDNCPTLANADQLDTDSDNIGDACDSTPNGDDDNDGIDNNADNCPQAANVNQEDADSDDIGDACDPDPTDPNPGVLLRKWGELKKDTFGISVANAGDVNNDGIDDVVVGAYLWDKPIPDSTKKLKSTGRVYVYSGSDGSELHALQMAGESSGDWFGYSVAGADVDGDGYSDVIVGAPRWDISKSDTQAALKDTGKVYIYSGATGDLIASVVGAAAGDNLGLAVARAGHVDADSNDDIVIGVPKADVEVVDSKPLKDAGRALVCSGAGIVASSTCDAATALFLVDGMTAGDWLGRSVAGAGDVNGDGLDDVIVGMPKADVSDKKDAGTAVVYDGATGQAWAQVTGENAADWFGYTVSGAGDLDGDGYADIAVGAYKHDATNGVTSKLMKDAGAVYAYSCAIQDACQPLFVSYGEAAGDRFGYSVAAGGDIDADGQPDVVAGAPGRDTVLPPAVGKTKGKTLKDAGAVYLLDGFTGLSLHSPLMGLRANDNRGICLANGGDIDLDGYSDIITATPKADNMNPNTLKPVKDVGFIEVMSGKIATGH